MLLWNANHKDENQIQYGSIYKPPYSEKLGFFLNATKCKICDLLIFFNLFVFCKCEQI